MKHIDMKYHFIKSKIDDGSIDIKDIPTSEMVADIFTKMLSPIIHAYHVKSLGLTTSPLKRECKSTSAE